MSLYNQIDEEKLFSNFKDLLIEYNDKTGSNIPTEYKLDLSITQQRAFERFKLGDNLLILGSAGVGKSKLVKEFYKYIKINNQKTMYLTSTTGISAYNLGGITINSFMGIGTGKGNVTSLLKKLRYKMSIKNRIQMTDILVIDEISMMSADIFEKLNVICQTLRKSRKPFGGIQIILTGDFLQLETVFDDPQSDNRLIIESELFKKMFSKSTINLTENFRQKNDNTYIDILMRIRKGNHTKNDLDMLNTRLLTTLEKQKINKQNDKPSIHLVSSNKKAQIINNQMLSEINSNDYEYKTIYTNLGDKDTVDLL